eukprot:GDKH01012316.1.p1 GENE.GDKH01012316.1~~GDKH01012316.1.p1  ORF type:complete len:245 (+),score=20.15 GDKH01012316.1:163-897(+)
MKGQPQRDWKGLMTDAKVGAAGGLFGLFTSYIVTNALLEISFNKLFSTFFGLGFMALGGVILLRALYGSSSLHVPQTRRMLLIFAAMILLSGVSCFFVEKEWFANLSYTAKIPMYSLLGVSLSFAITFAFVDLLNFWYDSRGGFEAPVHSSSQICVLICGSLFIGVCFGFFFGTFDVEDDISSTRVRLSRDRYVCSPLAAITGLVTSVITKRVGNGGSLFGKASYNPVNNMADDEAFFGDSETI